MFFSVWEGGRFFKFPFKWRMITFSIGDRKCEHLEEKWWESIPAGPRPSLTLPLLTTKLNPVFIEYAPYIDMYTYRLCVDDWAVLDS